MLNRKFANKHKEHTCSANKKVTSHCKIQGLSAVIQLMWVGGFAKEKKSSDLLVVAQKLAH